jgi:hypothetical protein
MSSQVKSPLRFAIFIIVVLVTLSSIAFYIMKENGFISISNGEVSKPTDLNSNQNNSFVPVIKEENSSHQKSDTSNTNVVDAKDFKQEVDTTAKRLQVEFKEKEEKKKDSVPLNTKKQSADTKEDDLSSLKLQ